MTSPLAKCLVTSNLAAECGKSHEREETKEIQCFKDKWELFIITQ